MVKKQIQTERGLICVDATFVSPEAAERAGYYYTFTSRKYGDLYSKVISENGLSRTFAIVSETAWINCGDINFVQHGGLLIRRAFSDQICSSSPVLRSIYDVLFAGPVDGVDNKVYACLINVDLDDFPDFSEEDPYLRVSEIVNYYGPWHLDGRPYKGIGLSADNAAIEREALAKWMDSLDAAIYIGEFDT